MTKAAAKKTDTATGAKKATLKKATSRKSMGLETLLPSTGITREPLNSSTWRMLRGEKCVCSGKVNSAARPIQLDVCLHVEGGWRPERHHASTGITREPLNSSTWRMLRGENLVCPRQGVSHLCPIQINVCLHVEGGWRPEWHHGADSERGDRRLRLTRKARTVLEATVEAEEAGARAAKGARGWRRVMIRLLLKVCCLYLIHDTIVACVTII